MALDVGGLHTCISDVTQSFLLDHYLVVISGEGAGCCRW